MLFRDLRIGFVIPQQPLRKSVQKVFRKSPGLDPTMVLTAFDVGESATDFDCSSSMRRIARTSE